MPSTPARSREEPQLLTANSQLPSVTDPITATRRAYSHTEIVIRNTTLQDVLSDSCLLVVDLFSLGQSLTTTPRIPEPSGRAVCVAQLAAAQRHVWRPAVPGATYIVIFGRPLLVNPRS